VVKTALMGFNHLNHIKTPIASTQRELEEKKWSKQTHFPCYALFMIRKLHILLPKRAVSSLSNIGW
jgi:hypothetical protein